MDEQRQSVGVLELVSSAKPLIRFITMRIQCFANGLNRKLVSGRGSLAYWMKPLITRLIRCGKPVECAVKNVGGAFEDRDSIRSDQPWNTGNVMQDSFDPVKQPITVQQAGLNGRQSVRRCGKSGSVPVHKPGLFGMGMET